jgi:hypothetical protein
MQRYLLGELSEAEQSALEQEYFTDRQVFDKMVRAENELVDNYARDQLTPQLRERFEQYYLAHPKRRERMKFAQALLTKLDQVEADHAAADASVKLAPWWRRLLPVLPGEKRVFAFSMALALLLLMLGGVWLVFQTRRLREELAQTQAARAAQEQHERELRQQLANEQTRIKDLNDELDRARSQVKGPQAEPPATPAFVTLLLTAGGIRGADTGPAPMLIIPAATEQVRLRLNVKDSDYPSYRVALQPVGGKEIFTRRDLKPKTTKAGATFVIIVPAGRFATGDYILTLKGVTQTGEVDDVSKSIFRVEKR